MTGGGGADILFFGGLATDAGQVIDSADALAAWLAASPRAAPDLSQLSGSFAAVLRRCDTIEVWNDLYGMISLFYFHDGRTTIISNRLHLASRELRRLGIRRNPHYDTIFASLSSTNLFFQQAHSHQTPVAGIFLLPVDEYAVISATGFARVKKPAMAMALTTAPRGDDYSELIALAAHDVVSTIKGLADYSGFRSAWCDLSGGVDSRVVFASVLRADAARGIPVRTFKSATDGDLEIGCGIAQQFRAHFLAENDRPRFSKRSDFGLSIWRSVKAGLHHRIGFNNWLSPPSAKPALHLYGASGELFRRFWLNACFGDPELVSGERDFFRSLFRRACRPGLRPDHLASAMESFVSALEALPGPEPLEKFEQHYLFFRNRFHFGITPYNLWSGHLDAAALHAPSLLRAWSALPPRDRRNGRVLFDLTDRLLPLLNCLPYANGFRWPQSITRNSVSYGELLPSAPPLPIEAGLQAWEEANATLAKARPGQAIAVDALSGDAGLSTTVLNAARNALSSIREGNEALASFLDRDFERWFEGLCASRPRQAIETASKLMSVFDLCFDEDDRILSLDDLPQAENYIRDDRTAVVRLGAELFPSRQSG